MCEIFCGFFPPRNKIKKTRKPHLVCSYLVGAGSKQEQVERYGGNDVDEKPAFEIMDGDLPRMTDDLVLLVNVRRAEVDENVDDKHDVDDQVDYRDWVMIATATASHKLKVKVNGENGKGSGTCYSASYMSRNQKRFII